MMRTRCPNCKGKLLPGQKIHEECIDPWAESQQAKAERLVVKKQRAAEKLDQAETRKRKQAAKPPGYWREKAQTIVNEYVRLRDRNLGCCSCDKSPSWDGQWHASHLRSIGAASAIRFNLWNIAKSCSICNNYLSGNIATYLPRARERWGNEKIDWLYAQNQTVKYSVEYLKRLKSIFARKVSRLEKRCNAQ